MGWQWTLEGGAFVLRHAPLPRGVADYGIVGRALVEGSPGPLAGRAMVRLEQVHGSAVQRARKEGLLPACDGVVTREPGLLITVRVADCLPILLAAPEPQVALVHAGWRGLAAGVLEKAVAHFRRAGEIEAIVGPAIGPCCFEVGSEVAERFPADATAIRPGGRPHVDLYAAARRRLLAAGVAPGHIAPRPPCTRCHQHLLHSHRGSGGDGGRNVAFAAAVAGGATHHEP